MQVAFFQRINNDIMIFVNEVKEEIEPSLYPILKNAVVKRYPAFMNYEIKKACLDNDYKFILQLYDEKVNDYRVVKI